MAVVGVVLALAIALVFGSLNGAELVTVNLGFLRLYRVPVAFVAFGGIVLGMLVMLVASVHTDLKIREILRERLQAEDREEKSRIDRNQRDLFTPESD